MKEIRLMPKMESIDIYCPFCGKLIIKEGKTLEKKETNHEDIILKSPKNKNYVASFKCPKMPSNCYASLEWQYLKEA